MELQRAASKQKILCAILVAFVATKNLRFAFETHPERGVESSSFVTINRTSSDKEERQKQNGDAVQGSKSRVDTQSRPQIIQIEMRNGLNNFSVWQYHNYSNYAVTENEEKNYDSLCKAMLETFGANATKQKTSNNNNKTHIYFSSKSCQKGLSLGNRLGLIYYARLLASSIGSSFSYKCNDRDQVDVSDYLGHMHYLTQMTDCWSKVGYKDMTTGMLPSLETICASCDPKKSCRWYPHESLTPSFDLVQDWRREMDGMSNWTRAVLAVAGKKMPPPSDVAIHLRCGDVLGKILLAPE